MKALSECRLYAFVDAAYLNGRAPEQIASELCEGGADIIQLRAKGWSREQIRELARTLLPVTRDAAVRLVINDHPEIAIELGADFCHLGQEDFFDAGYSRVNDLRAGHEQLGIGLSSHAPEQALRAIEAGADYIAIGPVYATGTKVSAKPVTLEYVRWAAAHVSIPWFAIGGINLSNLGDVLAAGAQRICVVSAILNSTNIRETCREFRRRLPA